MEPERQIEKRLRAFAKRRRADGGDAFQLQPWGRRQLQDEVSKRFAKPDKKPFFPWPLFRWQWTLITGFALLVVLGATLFLPASSKPKFKAKNVATRNQLREAGSAVQRPASPDARTNGYPSGGAMLDRLETNAMLAYSSDTEDKSRALFAGESLRTTNEGTLDSPGLHSAKPATSLIALTASAPAPTTAPAARQLGKVFENNALPVMAGRAFYQTKLESAPSVLASFELRRNGDAITIVDRDGSVYRGTITPENVTGQAVGGLAPSVAASQGQPRPDVHFRVSGESQSLKKNIVFLGRILSVSSSVATNSTANSVTSPSTRITGTATIDSTNAVRIDAVPVAP